MASPSPGSASTPVGLPEVETEATDFVEALFEDVAGRKTARLFGVAPAVPIPVGPL
ncbi:MAG TPA: hypothetical protein VND89_01410 [Acidimicrobiales bacterium]|nr:hypothetical protein [Acidimicrobiales bacterium]